MCVIIVKPAGLDLPAESTLEKCWRHNRDGAGFAYSDGNRVHFHKGFLTFDDFIDALNAEYNPDHSFILHFRWATHGGVNQAMTHPFSCASSTPLTRLSGSVKIAVFHNGVIGCVHATESLSDTAVYSTTELYRLYKANPDFYRDNATLSNIRFQTGSKFAFLTSERWTTTPGFRYYSDGCLYSNFNWA